MAASMRQNIRMIITSILGRSIPLRHISLCCQFRQETSGSTSDGGNGINNQSEQPKPDTYVDMMESRLDQAAHSLLVKVPSGASLDQVLQYMSQEAGGVANCFPHSQKGNSHYALIEFKEENSLLRLIKKTQDRHYMKLSTKDLSNVNNDIHTTSWPEINKAMSDTELGAKLNKAGSISEQLQIFHENQRLQEPEIRLRFVLCMLLENAFQNLLPECHVYPFGSSVNGFGKRNCDVDMYVDRGLPRGIVPVRKRRSNSYDLSYSQKAMSSERAGTQITLQTLSSYLRRNIPHCYGVFDILHAHCPLVKFQHMSTGLSCDMTADNRLGLTSSELLYVNCNLDIRVPQLVFMVRHWARVHKITHTAPGYWITNFPLTLLVIFFLQSRSPAVVPSLDYLSSIAGREDQRKVNGIDTTIVGDLSQVPKSTNVQSVENLLQEFFHFCATFDFSNRALSIRRGDCFENPDPAQFSLYIENPFETHLNASKNVKQKLIDHIRDKARISLEKMSRTDFTTPVKSSIESGHIWGIPLLFHLDVDNRNRLNSILNFITNDDVSNTEEVDVSEPGHDLTEANEGNVIDHKTDDIVDHVTSHMIEEGDRIKAEQRTSTNVADGRGIATLRETLESFPNTKEEQAKPSDKSFDGEQKLDLEELRLEVDGKATQLIHMYAAKHNLKVHFTFLEEYIKRTNSRSFRAECHLGEYKTYGKASTKKKAKHQAAKYMMRNLRGEFIDKKLYKILKG